MGSELFIPNIVVSVEIFEILFNLTTGQHNATSETQ